MLMMQGLMNTKAMKIGSLKLNTVSQVNDLVKDFSKSFPVI